MFKIQILSAIKRGNWKFPFIEDLMEKTSVNGELFIAMVEYRRVGLDSRYFSNRFECRESSVPFSSLGPLEELEIVRIHKIAEKTPFHNANVDWFPKQK